MKTFVDDDTRTGEQLLEDIRAGQPPLKLLGTDANAFAIMGATFRAVKAFGLEHGYSRAAAKTATILMQAKLTAGGYDRLLATVQDYFDVE